MPSSLAFKITASAIKPTRESLLDYCSYILVVISLISIARVLIGREELKVHCNVLADDFDAQKQVSEVYTNNTTELQTTSTLHNFDRVDASNAQILNKSKNLGRSSTTATLNFNNFTLSSQLQLNPVIASTKTKTEKLQGRNDSFRKQTSVCFKHYQAYFSYFLLIESLILLLIGILWVKMPKVNSLITDFSKLFKQCQEATWLTNILEKAFVSSSSTAQSLPLIFKSDMVDMEIHVLLSTLFDARSNYQDKAKARIIYENVQKFCLKYDSSHMLWHSYIRKSLWQFFFWLLFLCVNMVLFVKMEFYIGCNSPASYCDHDTFLRIIWFMTQPVILAYGMFNCSTLKWINDKSVSNPNPSSFFSFCGCCVHIKCAWRFTCRPFRIKKDKKVVYNDVALLLHLVHSTKPQNLPYFTFFLYHQWKDKFKIAGEEVKLTNETTQSHADDGVFLPTYNRKEIVQEPSAMSLLDDYGDTVV